MSEEFKEIRGENTQLRAWHLQLFRERLSEKMCLRQSRKVIWDMIGQYADPDTVTVESSILLSFSALKQMSMASRAILSNFFEKQ